MEPQEEKGALPSLHPAASYANHMPFHEFERIRRCVHLTMMDTHATEKGDP